MEKLGVCHFAHRAALHEQIDHQLYIQFPGYRSANVGNSATLGDLPLPVQRRKWPHIDFLSAGFIGDISEPLPIGRNNTFR